MDHGKTLLRNKIRLLTTSAIVFASTLCALTMSTHWDSADSAPPFITTLCAHCYPVIDSIIPGTKIHLVAHLLMYILMSGVLASGLVKLVKRWWKNAQAIAAIESSKQAPYPPRVAKLVASMRQPVEVSVIASEKPFAFCYGLFRPRICLSTALIDCLGDSELQAVLCHERHHQTAYAPLRLFLADLLSETLFFVPVLCELRDWLAFEIELSADRYAVGLAGRPALASALYRLLNHPVAPSISYGPAIVGLSVTDVRIAQLLGERATVQPVSRRRLVLSVIEVIVGLACLL